MVKDPSRQKGQAVGWWDQCEKYWNKEKSWYLGRKMTLLEREIGTEQEGPIRPKQPVELVWTS